MNHNHSKAYILVVEDDVIVAGSLERSLRAHDFSVTVATSGVEGLSQARRHRPDLVVLDVVMPGLDGLEVCRQIRADPLLADLPLLFLTARDSEADKVAGLTAGADDYLTKPFNLQEFILRIRAILRRSRPKAPGEAERPARLSVRDLVLDCQALAAITPAGTRPLTPIQYDLLYFLMTHPGEIFSPLQLLRQVWDYPFDAGSPDLVRVHVKHLRQRIEPDPAHPTYVTTVPGHGYTIRP